MEQRCLAREGVSSRGPEERAHSVAFSRDEPSGGTCAGTELAQPASLALTVNQGCAQALPGGRHCSVVLIWLF